MESVAWGWPVGMLAAGVLIGLVLLWVMRVAPMGPAPASGPPPMELRDLDGRLDTLVGQLRELDDLASTRSPDQLARERYALELEAASTWRERERGGARVAPEKKAKGRAAAAPAPAAPDGFLASRPALRGFVWGTLTAASLGALVFVVWRQAKPREEGGSLTGDLPPMGSRPPAPAADDETAQLQAVLAQNPDDLDARLALAQLHLRQRDLMGVWNETQYVLERQPGQPRALAYQALVRLAMNQPDVAVTMLKQAMATDPNLIEVYLHLALVYVRTGRVKEAEEVIEQASKRFPGQAPMLARVMTEMRAVGEGEAAAGEGEQAAGEADPHEGIEAAGASGLAGVIELPAALRARVSPDALVFVTVRDAASTEGPPVAVKRLPATSFPLSFSVGPSDSMMGSRCPRAREWKRASIRTATRSRGSRPTPRPGWTASPPAARACGSCFNSACRRHPRRPRLRRHARAAPAGHRPGRGRRRLVVRPPAGPELARGAEGHLHRRRRVREPVVGSVRAHDPAVDQRSRGRVGPRVGPGRGRPEPGRALPALPGRCDRRGRDRAAPRLRRRRAGRVRAAGRHRVRAHVLPALRGRARARPRARRPRALRLAPPGPAAAGPGAVLGAGSLLWGYLAVVFTTGGVPASSIPTATRPDSPADTTLRDFITNMPAPGRQMLSDALDRMRRGPALTLPAPRVRRGSATAPVRFVEFTDVRCSHCATLHQAWEQLEKSLPPDSFSLESRYFPLDGGCNPVIRSPARDPVRCLAPRVQICRELDPGAHALAGALFAEQRTLTPQRVYELAGGDRAALDACVASPDTARTLEGDVALAEQYSPDGTPIVLVNGRLGSAHPPFLYAIALARGSPDHPAFSVLPPPNPAAHIH